MIEIECPKCHTVFEEDESKFASIVQQVRDREFHKELEAQVATIKKLKHIVGSAVSLKHLVHVHDVRV